MPKSGDSKQPQNGHIVLDRSILEHWVRDDPEKFGAWIDMLLMANWRDNRWNCGMKIVEIPRGSFVSSQSGLAKRWGWSRCKIQTFLKMLESQAMIRQETGTQYTKITILNYNKYQDVPEGRRQQKGSKQAADRHRTGTTEQSKQSKQYICDKPKWGKRDDTRLFQNFVWLKPQEHEALSHDFGADEVKQKINVLAGYLEDDEKTGSGKKYRAFKNHSRCLRKWLQSDLDKIISQEGLNKRGVQYDEI